MFSKIINITLLSMIVSVFLVKSVHAQNSYPNVTQFFNENSYGTFAFVWGADQSSKIRKGPFVPVVEGEVLSIPKQRGYCVVVQHYGGQPVGKKHDYSIRFYANEVGTEVKTLVDANFSSKYDIADRASHDMPSYCFRRKLRDHFWIEVSSSDGEWFDGSYELKVED